MSREENEPAADGDPAKPALTAHPIFNWMSIISGGIIAVSATAMLFFVVMGLLTNGEGGYAGLLLLPPFLFVLVGAAFFVGGWIREMRRQARGQHSSFFQRYTVDPWKLFRQVGPIAMLAGLGVGTFALLSAGAASVAVVEFSESNVFCGEVCHAVMSPEATTYAHTAHSRVDCVECHVGPGAAGFMAAKIGGLRQLWGVVLGEITRPIPTPIHGGTINRALCESCHAAERDIGYKTLTANYFLNGQEDAPIQLAMVVKVGGGSTDGLLKGAGIHYHMQIANVEYIARDAQRQDIAWVRVTHDGEDVREYSNTAAPLTEEEKATLPVRAMECVDCHSRAAHAFKSPIDSVNQALSAGRLPNDVPYLKEASVRALDNDYTTTEQAMAGIGPALAAYYEDEDPEVLADQGDTLNEAAEVLRGIYRLTIFPEMKADWRAHPNNAGHRDSLGCFRCHNEDMVDDAGDSVFSDCTKCHAILAQDDAAIKTMSEFDIGRGFVHPEDFSTVEEFSDCSECHTGGKALYE